MVGPARVGGALPTFLGIGTSRSGTTSLHHYLGQHPEIFMSPQKEPNFFAFDEAGMHYRGRGARAIRQRSVLELSDYEALFAGGENARARGEISPRYLHAPGVPERIRRRLPEVRLFAILRHPADRAWAAFVSNRRDGTEPCSSILAAITDENRRIAAGWPLAGYQRVGCYASHLRRYLSVFPAEQIKVFLYDDLVADAPRLLRDLFGFLGVDADYPVDTSVRHNRSSEIRDPLLRAVWRHSFPVRVALRSYLPIATRDRFFGWFTRNARRPRLDPVVRTELTDRFRDQILDLEELIGRDLSHWLEPAPDGPVASHHSAPLESEQIGSADREA